MKGLANVSANRLDSILPVIELTKSRRSKINPIGAISKNVEKTAEVLGDRAYIADLTSMSGQASSEISQLLDPGDSFKNWTDFVASKLPRSCIPVVHLTEPFDAAAFIAQVGRLRSTNFGIALRIPVDYPHYAAVANLMPLVSQSGAVIVLADAEYVRPSEEEKTAIACHAILSAFSGKAHLGAPICSSFPSSVTLPEYGGDGYGKFELVEVGVSDRIRQGGIEDLKVVHGDYALIHPLEFDGTVTNWVPRVDVPLDRSVFYHRVRRHAGGYVQAAANALADSDYLPLDCWGHQNVAEAAGGAPLGRSPAHWIAVRVNFHISRQVDRLS